MSGDAKMQNALTIMRQHQEHIQDLEPDRRHRKEVVLSQLIPFKIKRRIA